MKMHFTKALGVCCTLALFFLTTGNANAQCLTDEFGQWPSAAYTPPACDGSLLTVTSAAFTSEYSVVNVVSGETYIFSSSVASHYITISTDAGATAAAFGTGPVEWTSTLTGEVRFYTHLSDACDGENISHSRQLRCGEPDCPALNANIGDSCDDGDPGTINDVVTENCTCEGIVPPAGATCDDPIEVVSLPYTTTDNTENYFDVYSNLDMPTGVTYPDISTGFQSAFYLNGDDAVYEYTASADGALQISLDGLGTWVGLYVFKGCPFTETLAYHIATSGSTRNIQALPVTTGETIYVVISTNPAPQSTPYTLTIEEFNFDCPALEADIGDLCDANGAPGLVDENCNCEEAVFEGCTNGTSFGARNVACQDSEPGSVEITGSWTEEFSPLNNAAVGQDFTFSVSGHTGDIAEFYLTVTDESDNILAFGTSPLSWSSTVNGTIRFYTHGTPACEGGITGGPSSHVRNVAWECENLVFDCPELEANIGDSCDDEDPGTFDDVVNENCECIGTPFDCPALEANIGAPCDDGDFFTINTTIDANCECTGGTPVPAGGACFNPIAISSLPFTDTDNTENFLDIYSSTDMPAGVTFPENSTGGQSGLYLNGDDAVYSFIPSSNGAIDITLSDHGTWAGLWVFTGCPEFDATIAYHTGSDASGRSIEGLPVQGGQVYFIVVSTFPAPQSIDYTLTIEEAEFDCPTLEANIGNSCDDGDPGTFDEIVTENCECVGTPYDCPAQQAMFGDICDFQGDLGIIDEECDCVEFVFQGCTNGVSFGLRNVECQGTDSGFVEVPSAYVQEYSPLENVNNGQAFTFSVLGHTGDIDVFYVTITDATGDNVLASGVAPLQWTSTVGGNIRYYTHGSPTCFGDITGFASSHVRRVDWDCTGITFDCPALEANFGDSCDDGDPGTFDDVITENCECEGTPYDCPSEQANFGDSCDDVDFGVINESCDCVAAVFEGCTVEDFGLFGEFETECDSTGVGSFTQTGAWVQEYAEILVLADVEYTFYTSGLPAGIPVAYITLTDTDNNILEFDTDTLVWTAPAAADSSVIRFWVHGAPDCVSGLTGGASSHSKTIDYVCAPEGCTANGGTLTALTPRSICVGTGTAQGIDIEVTGASGPNWRWALLDSDGNVLATRVTNSLFSLDGRAPGNYRIRYIRYDNDVSLGGITNASQLSDLEGCWDISNAITIFLRPKPEGGTLTANSPTTVCANSGSSTVILTELTGAVGELSRFGIRRIAPSLGNPIVASGTSPNFNLNGFDPGTYEVRHLSYQTGTVVGSATEFFADIEGCFDASNGVTVSIVDCAAAQLSSSPNPTAGPSFVTFTNPREETATLEVYDMSGRLVSTLFRQVTTPDQEYRLEFDGGGLPNGVYLYRLTTPTEVIVDKFMIAK